VVEVLFYIITGCPCSSYRLDSIRPYPRWMIKVTHWDDSVEPKGITVRRRRDYRLIECLFFSFTIIAIDHELYTQSTQSTQSISPSHRCNGNV